MPTSHTLTPDGIKAARTDAGMTQLELAAALIDATPDGLRSFFFHWEFDASEWAGKGLMPRSTAQNIALGRRLVRFFGGELDENDCDDSHIDLRVPSQWGSLNDGREWYRLQAAKAAVTPLTPDEINDAQKVAAYA